jgi:hypothetical protein
MLNVLGALLFSNGLQNLNTSGEHAACSCGVPWDPPCCATDAVVTINSASTKPNFFDIVRPPQEPAVSSPSRVPSSGARSMPAPRSYPPADDRANRLMCWLTYRRAEMVQMIITKTNASIQAWMVVSLAGLDAGAEFQEALEFPASRAKRVSKITW